MKQGIMYNKRNINTWEAARERQEGLLIGYLVSGDPSPETSLQFIKEGIEAGIDILELGIPSQEPKLDGPIIQRGHQRAIENGTDDIAVIIEQCRKIRSMINNPIWVMGYKAEVVDSGLYVQLAEQGLIDALVLPDCTLAEQQKIEEEVARHGVDVVRFVNGGMDDDMMRQATDETSIIYAQSYTGATGSSEAKEDSLAELCGRTRKFLPNGMIVAGFGLRTPDTVSGVMASGFDGAVVGTAFVSRLEHGEKDSFLRLIADMKQATMHVPN